MHQKIDLELASIRIKRSLRLEDASGISGLSVPTIRRLEMGKGTLASLLTYMNGLGFSLTWYGLRDANYGQSLAVRRQKLGISQRRLAKRLEIAHRTVIAMENQFKGRVETFLACMAILKLRPRLIEDDYEYTDSTTGAIDADLLRVLTAKAGSLPETAIICGDALSILRTFPSNTIDCVVTSPPYWSQRIYEVDGIGQEVDPTSYLTQLRSVFAQVHRVLKPRGSLWINIGDTYSDKSMMGIPWRLVQGLVDDDGWIVRNDVIWKKSGGALNRASNRLTHQHEHLFHLVKQQEYFYETEAIRKPPKLAKTEQSEITTATGVTLKKCTEKIHLSETLSESEKLNALKAVNMVFEEIAAGSLHDFRLVLRGARIAHSEGVDGKAGRAEELRRNGFTIFRYDPRGSLRGDVWEIGPDRTKGRSLHYAAFPEALCETPIRASCPEGGIVLDPFVGTGTTLMVAQRFNRHSIGIDLSEDYLEIARKRLRASEH